MRKKIVIITGIWLVVLIVVVNLGLWKLAEMNSKVKEQIGTCVVVRGEAAVVLDYSLLTSTYTLSNGKTVSFEFVEKANKR